MALPSFFSILSFPLYTPPYSILDVGYDVTVLCRKVTFPATLGPIKIATTVQAHTDPTQPPPSVLPPPPPRYTIPVAYAAGAANGMAVPVVETNNTISHPESGCPLQVGEGMCMHVYRIPVHTCRRGPSPSRLLSAQVHC
jgi:hypothetical protein